MGVNMQRIPNITSQNGILSYEDHANLWKDELKDWVPDVIFDAHVHLGPENITGTISEARKLCPVTTFTSLTYEAACRFYKELYSGKTVAGLIAFGFPFLEVNIEQANEYIAGVADKDSSLKGFIISHPNNTGKTIRQFYQARERGAGFCGVKPYYDLLGKSVYDTAIAEFVPDDLLEFMDSENLALMLHTGRIGMGDPECQDFVRRAVRLYPRVKIILAHMGRYLTKEQFFAFLDTDIVDCPNVFLEMSSASQPEVYERVLRRKDLWPRIMFGSDIPFGLITGNEYWSEESGPVFITRDEYAWSNMELNRRFPDLIASLTYNTYHTIKALKDGMVPLHLPQEEEEQLKTMIFYENALRGISGG